MMSPDSWCFEEWASPPPANTRRARWAATALRPQIADAVLQGYELAHFGVGERPVEDGEVVEVTHVGGPKHKLHRVAFPTESEIPVFDHALQLAVEPQATGGLGGCVVDIFERENDVRPSLA